MEKERFRNVIAVFLILEREDALRKKEILLMQRKNVSYGNGMFDCPAGHLEPNETLKQAIVRETKEETGIDVNEKDLELVQVCHFSKDEYIYFYFKTKRFEGTPQIMEKDKCDKLEWFKLDSLPKNLLIGTKKTLENLRNGIIYEDNFE